MNPLTLHSPRVHFSPYINFYTHIFHYHPFDSFFLYVSAPLHPSPSLSLSLCCLHFPFSSPAVDRIKVRPLWLVEQVTALTEPWFHSCAFCHLPVCPSHFNNVNLGQAQATENIPYPGAQSLEPRSTPEHLQLAVFLQTDLELVGFPTHVEYRTTSKKKN